MRAFCVLKGSQAPASRISVAVFSLFSHNNTLLSLMTWTFAPFFQNFTLTAVTYVKARHNDVYMYHSLVVNTACFFFFIRASPFSAEYDRNVCTLPAKIVSGRFQTVFPRHKLISTGIHWYPLVSISLSHLMEMSQIFTRRVYLCTRVFGGHCNSEVEVVVLYRYVSSTSLWNISSELVMPNMSPNSLNRLLLLWQSLYNMLLLLRWSCFNCLLNEPLTQSANHCRRPIRCYFPVIGRLVHQPVY